MLAQSKQQQPEHVDDVVQLLNMVHRLGANSSCVLAMRVALTSFEFRQITPKIEEATQHNRGQKATQTLSPG